MKINLGKKETVAKGSNFLELLFLLFLGLKLSGHITWSWVWVFSPLWIPALGVVIIFGVAFIYLIIANALDKGRIDGRKKN